MKSGTVTERGYSSSYVNFVIKQIQRLTPATIKILFTLANGPKYTRQLAGIIRSLDITTVLNDLERLGLIERKESTLKDFLGPKYPPIPIVVNYLTPKGEYVLTHLRQLAELLEYES